MSHVIALFKKGKKNTPMIPLERRRSSPGAGWPDHAGAGPMASGRCW